MRKIYCDMCGKEIGDLEGHHEVEVDGIITSNHTHTYEICDACIDQVLQILKGNYDKNVL